MNNIRPAHCSTKLDHQIYFQVLKAGKILRALERAANKLNKTTDQPAGEIKKLKKQLIDWRQLIAQLMK